MAVLFVVALLIPSAAVKAVPDIQETECTQLPPVNWKEEQSQSFAYIYPVDYEALLSNLMEQYGNKLEDEYMSFTRLYRTTLSLPVIIRIYPSVMHYFCLNILAPQVAPMETHSHVGMREIVLFGDRILADLSRWEGEFVNILRFELGVLFVEQITDAKAPPGLIAGVGIYMMDPGDIFLENAVSMSGISAPDVTWRALWENENTITNLGARLQAASTIAYLVEAYGWESLLQYLIHLRTSEGYRQSLAEIYPVDFSSLEGEWEKYYPLYYQGRWRAHILYDFDLSPYEQMIAGGAYTDAFLGLKDVIDFLVENQQSDKLIEAIALQELAKRGQEASALVLQARQALQSRQYEQSTQLADQAQLIFDQLGDQRRNAELDSYRAWAQEVQALQTELDHLLQEYQANGETSSSLDRMIEVSQRLAELGETQARENMTGIIQEEETMLLKQNRQYYMAVGAVAVLLLVLRILLLRLKVTREVI